MKATTEIPPDPTLEDLLVRLAGRVGLDVWMVTRRHDDELAVLATHGDGIPIAAGARRPWEDTVCARMAAGEGPRAAPALADVPAYAGTRLARELGLGAYIGVPIDAGKGVVGTICGLDRSSHQHALAEHVPVLELCAGLIGRLWSAEREARTDPLTELPNRRAWEEALEREEERCRRFDHPAGVVAVDLDDFKRVNDRFGHAVGDEHLGRTATMIVTSVRDHDFVARWGGDEFCVLAVECDEQAARALCRRIADALDEAGVAASVALGMRGPPGLTAAVGEAFLSLQRGKHREAPRTGC